MLLLLAVVAGSPARADLLPSPADGALASFQAALDAGDLAEARRRLPAAADVASDRELNARWLGALHRVALDRAGDDPAGAARLVWHELAMPPMLVSAEPGPGDLVLCPERAPSCPGWGARIAGTEASRAATADLEALLERADRVAAR